MPSRRTKLVLDAIQAIAVAGNHAFAPADVGAQLRSAQTPMSAWEIRGELTTLEVSGDITIDPTTALWSLRASPSIPQPKSGAA